MVVNERTRLIARPEVSWDDPANLSNPKNWPSSRKWLLAILISLYALMGPVSSAIVVPALPEIADELKLDSELQTQLVVSLFVLGWGIGPMIIAPASEIFGRARMLNVGHFLFLCCNTITVLCTDKRWFMALRFITGLVGSAPFSLGAGVLADMWVSDQRGKSLAVYTVAPLLGPTIGPIIGGFMVRYLSWHWVFYFSSIWTAVTLLGGLMFLRETFAPVIQRSIRLAEAKERGEELPNETKALLKKLLIKDLPRPFLLLGTQPIIQFLALYMAYLFGLNYLAISTFQTLWRTKYHEEPHIASLNYLSIGGAFVAGCQIAGPVNDKLYALMKHKYGYTTPEVRTWIMVPASVLVPVGQLIYGYSAERTLHWVVPNIGMFIYSMGMIIGYQSIQAYVLDCYPTYAASAVGALTLLRACAGAAFPVIGPAIYRSLGYFHASAVLAACAIAIGGAAPVLLRYLGPALRARSPYAAGDIKVVL